jgi:hypothetical protein
MKRFYPDLDEMVKSKANDLYKDCCVEIIEANDLKDKAIDCALKVCEELIEDDEKSDLRDELTTLVPTLKNIMKKLNTLKGRSDAE